MTILYVRHRCDFQLQGEQCLADLLGGGHPREPTSMRRFTGSLSEN